MCVECLAPFCAAICGECCIAIYTGLGQFCFGKQFGAEGSGGGCCRNTGGRGCCNCGCFSIESDAEDDQPAAHRKKKRTSAGAKGDQKVVSEQPSSNPEMKTAEISPGVTPNSSTPAAAAVHVGDAKDPVTS